MVRQQFCKEDERGEPDCGHALREGIDQVRSGFRRRAHEDVDEDVGLAQVSDCARVDTQVSRAHLVSVVLAIKAELSRGPASISR
jgi:hypothetical protein